jgi:hypothetical protein
VGGQRQFCLQLERLPAGTGAAIFERLSAEEEKY